MYYFGSGFINVAEDAILAEIFDETVPLQTFLDRGLDPDQPYSMLRLADRSIRSP
jgi:hypothetical protein